MGTTPALRPTPLAGAPHRPRASPLLPRPAGGTRSRSMEEEGQNRTAAVGRNTRSQAPAAGRTWPGEAWRQRHFRIPATSRVPVRPTTLDGRWTAWRQFKICSMMRRCAQNVYSVIIAENAMSLISPPAGSRKVSRRRASSCGRAGTARPRGTPPPSLSSSWTRSVTDTACRPASRHRTSAYKRLVSSENRTDSTVTGVNDCYSMSSG